MGLFKSIYRAIWGGTDPSVEITAPIPCEACRIARVAGKDACPEHHTHHTRHAHDHGDHGSPRPAT